MALLHPKIVAKLQIKKKRSKEATQNTHFRCRRKHLNQCYALWVNHQQANWWSSDDSLKFGLLISDIVIERDRRGAFFFDTWHSRMGRPWTKYRWIFFENENPSKNGNHDFMTFILKSKTIIIRVNRRKHLFLDTTMTKPRNCVGFGTKISTNFSCKTNDSKRAKTS